MKSMLLVLALLSPTTGVVAHELTPTYPDLKPSYVDGLLVAKMSMFNARKDVDYYEIGVFSEDWVRVPFATQDRIIKVPYGNSKTFEIYVRREDRKRAVYVCTMSKLRSDKPSNAIIASKVCSRMDGARP